MITLKSEMFSTLESLSGLSPRHIKVGLPCWQLYSDCDVTHDELDPEIWSFQSYYSELLTVMSSTQTAPAELQQVNVWIGGGSTILQ